MYNLSKSLQKFKKVFLYTLAVILPVSLFHFVDSESETIKKSDYNNLSNNWTVYADGPSSDSSDSSDSDSDGSDSDSSDSDSSDSSDGSGDDSDAADGHDAGDSGGSL